MLLGHSKKTLCPRSLIAIGRWGGRKLPRTCGTEALLTKPIDFAALRSEIDMRIERAA